MRATTSLYNQNQKLIKSRARYYAAKYHVPVDDVESEANEIFCRACLAFDPENGAQFSTYLHSRLQALNHYCKTLYREWQQIENIEDLYLPVKTLDPVAIADSLTVLSQESQELISALIFDGGHKLTVAWIKEQLKIGYEKAKRLYEEIRAWWFDVKACPVYM